MLGSPLFRERALIRSAQPEPLDDLLRVTAPHEWLLLACLAAALLAAALWGGLTRVEQTVSGAGALVQPGERYAIVSAASGVVTEVTAELGDRVEAGEAIARLELPELRWRLRISRARVALLDERARSPEAPPGGWLDAELAAARAEVLELAALDAAGAVIVSPRAGEIITNGLVAGQAIGVGEPVAEVRTGLRRAPEAVLFVAPEQSRRIDAGMKARVTVADRSGARVFASEVAEVSARPVDLPSWLSRIGLVSSEVPGSPRHLVRLTVRGAGDARMPDGVPCRVEIVVARHSPLGLLVSSAGRPR